MAGENRQDDHLARNPHGQMPALELDDGAISPRSLAICEYLEDTNPKPAADRHQPEGKGRSAHVDAPHRPQHLEPMANGFRFSQGLPLFKDRIVTVPEAADGLKKIAQDRLKWLDGQMAGREFLCGKRFTLADILLFCFLDFGAQVGQPLNPENKNVCGLVRPCEGKALDGCLIALSMASGFGGARRRQCPKMFP